MNYIFPIKIYPSTSAEPFKRRIGRIHETKWNIRGRWANDSIGLKLIEVEILRSAASETVDIELCLRPCNSVEDYYEYDESNKNYTRYRETLLYDVKTKTIPMCYRVSEPLKVMGFISICSFSHREVKDRHVVSSTSTTFDDLTKLSKDFLLLSKNPNSMSDATLICGKAEIPVHRCILSVRSPVFARMFSSQMTEGLCGIVDITDIKLGVLHAALTYIYSGKIECLTVELAEDLLFVADKYEMSQLRWICLNKLIANITSKNVCRILVLGHLHDSGLKEHAISYIFRYNYATELQETEGWKSLERNYPSLAMEVLKTVVNYLQQNRYPSVTNRKPS